MARRTAVSVSIRVIVGMLFLPFLVAHAATIEGRVVGVTDGDTITLLDAKRQQHKIRLAGIDAPEKAQSFGKRSKEHLSAQVFDKDVLAECTKHDRYRREICKVLVDDRDANLEQVRAGFAWWYRKYAKEQSVSDQAEYERAEREARAGRLGLWADGDPVPPWEWRHRTK